MAELPQWNHNIQYHRLVLDAVPAGARTALDVGTGDGLLAADLRARVPDVTAIDVDEAVLVGARAEAPDVRWVVGDVMTHPFQEGTFDIVASVATLHHLPDPGAALRRMASLTAPGGVLVVIGLARSSGVADVLHDLAGAVQHRWSTWRRTVWEHTAPTRWPPPHTYADVRRTADVVLPGAMWRRLAMWRYALVWRRPPDGAGQART